MEIPVMKMINLGKGLVETRGAQPNAADDDFEGALSVVRKASVDQVIRGCSPTLESDISFIFANGC
jgi:hypothetical protein